MELPRTQYSQEFREQSVKFFKESGLTLDEAAKRLSVPKGTLKNWIYADKRGEFATYKYRCKNVPLRRTKFCGNRGVIVYQVLRL